MSEKAELSEGREKGLKRNRTTQIIRKGPVGEVKRSTYICCKVICRLKVMDVGTNGFVPLMVCPIIIHICANEGPSCKAKGLKVILDIDCISVDEMTNWSNCWIWILQYWVQQSKYQLWTGDFGVIDHPELGRPLRENEVTKSF